MTAASASISAGEVGGRRGGGENAQGNVFAAHGFQQRNAGGVAQQRMAGNGIADIAGAGGVQHVCAASASLRASKCASNARRAGLRHPAGPGRRATRHGRISGRTRA